MRYEPVEARTLTSPCIDDLDRKARKVLKQQKIFFLEMEGKRFGSSNSRMQIKQHFGGVGLYLARNKSALGLSTAGVRCCRGFGTQVRLLSWADWGGLDRTLAVRKARACQRAQGLNNLIQGVENSAKTYANPHRTRAIKPVTILDRGENIR